MRKRKSSSAGIDDPVWVRVLKWIDSARTSPGMPPTPAPEKGGYLQPYGSNLTAVAVADFKRFCKRHKLTEVEMAKLIFRSYVAYQSLINGRSVTLRVMERAYDMMYRVDTHLGPLPRLPSGHLDWWQFQKELEEKDPVMAAWVESFHPTPGAVAGEESDMVDWEDEL